jgi:bifunctional UDP-N-acetylglucosamine pyrophosphorylase / glucosamine-1-phosphate N-acetyltransferase
MAPPPVAAVVLAAGKGTRMKSAIPKVLHPACGKPLLAWPVEAAMSAGASPIVVVTGHGREQVEAELRGRFGDRPVRTAHQAEQRGTGHAAQIALPALEGFTGTVLLLYGDCPLLTTPSLLALVELRIRTAAPVALWTTRLADPRGYGRIVRGQDGLLERIVEERDAAEHERAVDEVNPGVYAVDADWLRQALPRLRDHNAQKELYLTDLVAIARQEGHGVPTLEVPAQETLGVNDRVQLAEASAVLGGRIVRAAMLEGATFVHPASVIVDASVQFASDVVIGPHVVLTGRTRLADGVQVGAGSVLHDTAVASGAIIHPYTIAEGASVGPRCLVGPFARLRPGAVLEEGAHVGNFVELKKTRLGRGSKANHLAYLGDADIGAGANIGAGTITCNYDGVGKHLTQIGDGVFVGSNATLVAPVALREGAYVAAGSVITEEVPAGSLALGRARQVTKDGYAVKVRERSAARAAPTDAPKKS